MEDENVMYQQLQQIRRENVYRIKVLQVIWGNLGMLSFETPKIVCFYTCPA